MSRWVPYLVLVVMLSGSLPFAAWTCNRDVPEPPKQIARRRGFGALSGTRRRPEHVRAATITPGKPTLPAAGETPTPETVGLPENFPEDIPVFRDAEVMAVQELAGDARNVLFYADAETVEIFTYYRDTMSGDGWNVFQEYQAKDQSFLSFRKGKMITNMTVAKDPRTGKQIVAIMYYEEQPLAFPEF